MELDALSPYADDAKSWFSERDAIKRLIAGRVREKTVEEWMAILEPADIWCSPVYDWDELMASEGFSLLDMLQHVERDNGDVSILTTRSPLRFDGVRPEMKRAAPRVGEHSRAIIEEFGL